MTSSEFELIQHYFTGLGEGAAVRLGVGDDAAVLQVPEGHVLQISTDTALEGAHFLANLPAADIAYRSVMAAASDLAAMGAVPMASLLSLTLPEADSAWLRDFSTGLGTVCTETGLPLVGGDTTRGPLAITVTVMGSTPAGQFMVRSGAEPGDRLCVSGTLGDAAAGLEILKGDLSVADASISGVLAARFTRPVARLTLGQTLRDLASACIDISDGLLADAGHLATCSGVAIEVDSSLLPLSDALCSVVDMRQAKDWALAGGDDYELLFALPCNTPLPAGCTQIGRVVSGSGISCDRVPERAGYDHFAH